MRKPLIYLASPYSSGETYKERYKAVLDATCKLMERGYNIFSPVVYSHLIAQAMPSMGCSWLSWQAFDIEMLSRCDEIWQLCLPDWELSVGCEAERNWAFDRMPIKYIDANVNFFLVAEKDVDALGEYIPKGDSYLIIDNKAEPEQPCAATSDIESQADALVNGDRMNEYGDASQMMRRTAEAWGAILDYEVDAKDVALCMAALKLVREAGKSKPDNLIDAIGYIKIAGEIEREGSN